MQSKRFLSHLILSWCLRKRIRSRWEKFSLSYNPFFRIVQITILATARNARNTTRFSPFHGKACKAVSSTHLPQQGKLGISTRPTLKAQLWRVVHSERAPWLARIQSSSRSSSLVPSSIGSESEAALTTRSRYSSFQGQERSLDLDSLRRALRLSAKKNSASSLFQRRLSTTGFD